VYYYNPIFDIRKWQWEWTYDRLRGTCRWKTSPEQWYLQPPFTTCRALVKSIGSKMQVTSVKDLLLFNPHDGNTNVGSYSNRADPPTYPVHVMPHSGAEHCRPSKPP